MNIKNIISDSLKYSVLLLAFTTLAVFAKDNHITIAGSTTILPVSEKWAMAFKDRTGVTVNVHGGGSTGGIKATKLGTADIGACSRDLSFKERKSLKEVVIGRDALAVIVNKSSKIDDITLDQARGIFTGRIKNWKELGGLDKPIQVVNRESGSGTRELFVEVVMKIMLKDKTRKTVPMSLSSIVNNSNAEVKETVKLVPTSVGYLSVGFVDDSVKVVKIDSVFPTQKNILNGEYSLVRNLYYLVNGKKNKKIVQNFLKYVLSREGQELIVDEGFFPALSFNNKT